MNKRSVLLALTVLILLCLTTVATFAKPSADTSADMAVASCEVDFNAVLEWEWTGSTTLPDSDQVMMSPAVIDITGDAVPDIVFASFVGSGYAADPWKKGNLRAIDGRTGAEIFTVTDSTYDVRAAGSVAVGDIDGDNQVEIIAIHPDNNKVIAFEHDGTYKWTSPTGPVPFHAGGASIADLDHDGNPEVVIGATVLNNDGTLRFQGTAGLGDNAAGPLSIVVDLDMDGDQEVVAGNTAYRSNGDIYWQKSEFGDGFAAIGNFDDDDYPEVVVISAKQLTLLEHDGTIKWGPNTVPRTQYGGAPVVADLDGDGELEIGITGSSRYFVFEADGSEKWNATTVDDNSNLTGSSAFDFNGDGAAELIHSDQEKLRIFNGSDGTVLWETDSPSGTTTELPVIVDVDADNHAEIVMVSNNYRYPGAHGIQIYGHPSWPDTRDIWNQHSYHITNINDDGTIPTNEAPSWTDHNSYRLNLSSGGCDESCTPTFADKQIIDADFGGAISVYSADVDGDGDLDILGAAQSAGQIAWWENNGGTFSKHIIDNSFSGAFSVYVDDMDSDGDLDVLGASFGSREVAWWANNGDGSSWTKHVVNSNSEMAYSVRTADFDGDGHKDVVAAFSRSQDVIWWSNNGDGTVWTEHVIDADFYGAQAVETADIDGDGHLDVLGAASEGHDIAWWQNNGNGSGWTEHLIDGNFRYAVSVQGADVDGDGDVDLLGAATYDNEITWWENDGSPVDGGWIEHVIDGEFSAASWVDTVDMDQDGDLDVLGAARDSGGSISWWENNGDGSNWLEHVVETDFNGAHSVMAVDLDGDEDLDLIGAAYRARDMAWWENECNDVPPPPPPPPPTCTPNFLPELKHVVDGDFDGGISVYPADIDGDGDTDILGAAQYADDITWWENNGDGTLLSKHAIDDNFDGAFSVYADDVDNDGDLDVLGAAFGTNEVAWWENNGDGTSWSKHVVGTGTQGAYSVRTGDFDGDGDRDVVGAFVDDKIVWWTNNGNGTWSEHVIDSDFDGAQAVEAVDLDQDGDIDILGAARYGNDVTWWENSGDGSSWTERLVDGEFRYAVSVQAADVDGDGDLDLLGTATDGDDVSWWENDGNAAGWSEHVIDGEFDGASWVSTADMDKDGDIDVLGAARDGGGEVTWWQNDGTGTSWTEHVVDSDFDGGHSVFATDMDGDNDLDILAAAYRADDVAWWENDNDDCEPRACTPSFSENSKHLVDQDFDGAISVYPADVDGDGDTDILSAGQYADDITWWENNGDGSTLTKHTIDANFDGAFSVYADDVDKDGDLDVLGAGFGTNQVAWWANNGDGTSWTKEVIGTGTQGAYSVRTGDLDGDGDRDAVGAFVDDKITWWANNGDGTWTEHAIDSDFDGAQAVEVVDLDQDGDMDVLGAARYGNDITWWENSGNGSSWTEHLVDDHFRYAVSVQAADVDGDGDLDLLGAATNDDDITWWENDGNAAGWTEHLIDGEFDGASWVSTADMDFDGDLDVLGAARDGGGEVAWWENDGTGTSWTDHVVDTDFDGGHSIFATDIDGDENLDILAVAYRADDVAWWENDSSGCDPEICTPAFPTDEKHVVDADFGGAISVYTADLDDDGDMDILSAGQAADDITWWENNGNGSVLSKHTIDGDFDRAFSVYAADVDGDGDLDVLGAAHDADEIAWWENTAGNASVWTKHLVDHAVDGAFSVRTADIDGDNDLDIIGAAVLGHQVIWWEQGAGWARHEIDGDFIGAQAVEAVDLDQDGDMDVLGAARYGDDITWWENSGNGSNWTEHLVDGEFDYAVSVQAADIDKDGDLDLIGAATQDDDITWWENDGNTAGWTAHLIDGDFDGASWVSLADMDEDGDLDVLGAARDGGGAVAWWQNNGSGTSWSKYVVESDFNGGHSVFATDINGDNELDIVAVAFRASDVVWWGSNNDYCDDPPSDAPDLTISKDDGQSAVRAGDRLTYTITVENVVTTTGASGVVISDSLPANTTFISASNGGTEAAGTVTWNVGDLAGGASATRTLVVQVNNIAFAHKTPIINTVSVTDDGTHGDDPTPDNNRDDDIDYVDTSEPPICTGTFPDKQIINGDFNGSISVYPADVDGDGDQDILGAGQYADDITWWENDGNGAFTEHTIDGDFDGAFSVYADDVDKDGDVDVLGASFGSNEVAWWANNGDGTWTKHVIGTSTRGAYSVRTADVDGDGDLDALGAWLNNRITWWANNGDGTSWTEYEIDTDFGGAQAVEVADLDADGDIDVLGAARYGNDITWWENSGDGSSWTEHVVDGEFRYAVSVEAADMDGDGDLDLLGSATHDDDVTWWENDGSAAGWAEHVVDGEFDGASWAMAIDMDYDGDLDVLGAGRDNGEVAWWQNQGGDGTLWKKHVVDDQFRGSHAVYAVDLDGNYALDIVAAAYIEDDVAWWRNDCEYAPDLGVTKDDGLSFVHPGQVITYTIRVDNHSVRDGTGVVLSDTLPAHTTFVSASDGGSETSGIVTWNLGTLNGHSNMTRTVMIQVNDPLPVDLITITNTVSVADDGANGPDPVPENNRDDDVDQVDHTPQFCEVSFPDKQIIDPDFDGAWDVHAADIDGDGDMDALSAAANADDITWWENADGAGLTWSQHTIDGFYDKASSVYAVDMDNDGDIDVLGSAELDHDVTWWENDGTPRNGGWTEHTVEGGFVGAHGVYVADINGDGFLDVLGVAAVHDRITWWKNDGTPSNGGWVAQHLNTSFDTAYSVYAEDVDADGDMDILGAARDGDQITWWENSAGDGSTWAEQVIDDTVDGAHEIHVADIDGDGDLDVLSAASEDDDITWWENDGSPADGGWTEHTVEGNFDGASSVYAIDLDLDGDLDMVGAAQDGHLVGWWENFGNGLYWNSYLVDPDFAGAWSIYSADLDGDTDFDIMGAAFDADDVAWWENKCIDAPELSISKDDGLTLVRWGDVMTYTIIASNAPGQDASGVVITDTLPAHTTFIAASDGGTQAGGIVKWSIGDLAAGTSITRTLTVQLNSPVPLDVEYITNTVSIGDDGIHGPDPKPDNNTDDDVDEVEHPGHIKGNLRLVGRHLNESSDTYYNGATVKVIDKNNVVIATTTSDANGDFLLNNVPTGPNTPYTIRAEMELYLYAERSVDVLEKQTSTMPFLPLWPGDSNGDGKVNMVDLTALTTLLNNGADIYSGIKCANNTSWNPATEALPKQLDFNGNCVVDITDIGLHSGTIAAFFSGTNGSVGEDMPIVQITPGSPAEAGTPWP